MSWDALVPAPSGTHHLRGNAPAYEARFDEVLSFHAPGLAPVRREGVAFHIDERGIAAYTRRFARTFGFYEGRAAVIDPGGWLHILPDGGELYTARYAWCGNYQGARCAVRVNEQRYLHLESDGVPAYADRWRYAGDFREGAAVVQNDDGHSSHIDPRGELIHARWFIDLGVFHKGFACARDRLGWTHVNRRGEPLYARRFSLVEPFYNGQARVERDDGGREIIDQYGTTLVELRREGRWPPGDHPSGDSQEVS